MKVTNPMHHDFHDYHEFGEMMKNNKWTLGYLAAVGTASLLLQIYNAVKG